MAPSVPDLRPVGPELGLPHLGHLTRGPCGRARTTAPAVSVNDARAEEARGASLDFAVTLSRALSETVTVRYATSDGTARVGSDYRATSGTLTFSAGQTSQRVSVPVLDDDLDEGSETLTLTLSNPSPLHMSVADRWRRCEFALYRC